MFLDYYGLREQPFGVTPDPRFLYFSNTHREALASLFYGIECGCGFLALIAPPGMGKTTLLFHLLEKLRGSAQTAFLFQTQCGSREFFRYLLTDLGADASEQNIARMHEALNAVLLRNARLGRRFVLVIDEAQNLNESVLETVRLLSDFETPRAKLLQIVLSGQLQLADKLSLPSLAQLRQRISIASRLQPYSRVETMTHVEFRLCAAGYSGPPLFRYDALELIAAKSGGIPRNINNICFSAMTLGLAKRQKQIDASIVSEVLADSDIEGLGTRALAPARMGEDGLIPFDGVAPTDEASYEKFHNTIRSAWGESNRGDTDDEPVESQPVPINSGAGKHSPDFDEMHSPEASPAEMKGDSGESAHAAVAISPGSQPNGQSFGSPLSAKQQAQDGFGVTPKPAATLVDSSPANKSGWARALSSLLPYARRKATTVDAELRAVVRRTIIILALTAMLAGTLFLG
jgi:general secretion pathway protein A